MRKLVRVQYLIYAKLLLIIISITICIDTYAQDTPTGVLQVETDIERARIFLDNKLIGITKVTASNVAVGSHIVKISHRDYITLEKDISITEADTLMLFEELVRGYLVTINTLPSRANIYVNNELVGQSPVDLQLQKETYLIEVTKDYHDKVSESFEPTRQNEKLTIQLERRDYETIINTYPKNTSVMIDDDIKSDGDIFNLIGGAHELTIGKKGFKTFKGSFLVNDLNETQTHHFIIEPEKYRKKSVAMLYSVALPGMGQRYLKRGGYEPVLGLAGYGFLLGSLSKYNKAVASYDLYLAETDVNAREKLNNQWQKEKKQSEVMLYCAGAVWLGGIIWTIINDDERTHYNKIRTKVAFDSNSNTNMISLLLPLNK